MSFKKGAKSVENFLRSSHLDLDQIEMQQNFIKSSKGSNDSSMQDLELQDLSASVKSSQVPFSSSALAVRSFS